MSVMIPENLKHDASGLVPVVVQDRASGDILMVAYANAEALTQTAATGFAHFWSRSRNQLWKKGETSGNLLRVREARTDCDRDVLLLVVDPHGPTCHTGARTCFGDTTPTAAGILVELERVIADRNEHRPAGSYTAQLLAQGLDASLKKVGEEALEVILAAKDGGDEKLVEELADVLYHLEVVMAQRRIGVAQVLEVLRRRRRDRP
jgi:phosphoribosyl-AMP cyclohydrolase / phosphoribosyl-ATP pyrophosphohydrolase